MRPSAARVGTFGIVLLVSLAATFPLKLAAGWAGAGSGFAARDAEGAIWAGRLLDLRMAGLALGSPDAVAMPFSLPGGEPVLSLTWHGRDGLRGRASMSAQGASIDRLNGIVEPTGDLAARLPVGAIGVRDFSFRARNGRCNAAAGRVSARLAEAGAAMLDGIPRCDGGALRLPLQGGGRTLAVRIEGSSFTAELRGPDGTRLRSQGSLGR